MVTRITILLVVLGASFASAATITVPGSFTTIQAAISAASDGDLILVAPGVYTQNLDFGGKILALRSTAGPASTIIHVSGGVGVSLGGASELNGFTITGANSVFGAGVVVNGVGTLIKGNIFDGNTESTGGYGAAIGGDVASPIIDGNVFRNNTADEQHLSGVVCFINGSSPTIINNIFEDNTTRAINFVLPSGNNPVVINNTFVRNEVAIKYGSFSTTICRNNILDGNTTGFLLDYPGYQPTWENNDVYNNTANYAGGMPDLTGVSGNISADPEFVSASDLELLSGSPAIDSGSPLLAPDHDIAGDPRPMGGGYDMGAYEVPEPNVGLLLLPMAGALALLRPARSRFSGS
ncbi:MAG: right-handed parallel beta-helix repeat-containing protein [Tepidisphaeraceae bacterium]|jgi:hypothetical protein